MILYILRSLRVLVAHSEQIKGPVHPPNHTALDTERIDDISLRRPVCASGGMLLDAVAIVRADMHAVMAIN